MDVIFLDPRDSSLRSRSRMTLKEDGEVNIDIAAAMTFLDSRDWHILWGVPPKNDNREEVNE